MQELIQELGQKYQKQVEILSQAYNNARTAQTPNEIKQALNKAQTAIDEMERKLSPAQKEAQEIDKRANDIAQKTNEPLKRLIEELQNVLNSIDNDQKLIEFLENKIKELQHGDRYAPGADGIVDFKLNEASDFWKEINRLGGASKAQSKAVSDESLVAFHRVVAP